MKGLKGRKGPKGRRFGPLRPFGPFLRLLGRFLRPAWEFARAPPGRAVKPSTEKLKNPYADQIDAPTIRVTAKICWLAAGIFLGLITLTPILRNLTDAAKPEGWTPVREFFVRPTDEAVNLLEAKRKIDPRITRTAPDFIDHRESWEAKLDDADFIRPPRRALQSALTSVLREGNRKTVIGGDGWLFFRPAIDSLTGYGPLKGEPDSVAKDPTRPPWQGPKEVILEFAGQLRQQGVELMLAPIPVKPTIYDLSGKPRPAPLSHRDAARFYREFRNAGVEVLDLAPMLSQLAQNGPVFLKQDTHWTPQAMERCAEFVAGAVKERPWFPTLAPQPDRFSQQPGNAEHIGDLVEKLDLPGGGSFKRERVSLNQVIEAATGEPAEIYDHEAAIVLLGDSFTNIFSAESMHWGENAGFAQHLALHLGLSLDTIAQNGQASTGVRHTLASRPGALEGKKLVIWAIAARDLFLSETVARETNVEWRQVAFNTAPKPKKLPEGAFVVKGEMIERAALRDPNTVPYPASLYAAKYRVLEVVEGSYAESEVLVYHWGFRERKLLPSAGFQVGDTRELTLVPFAAKTKLQSINRADLDDFLLLPYWAEDGG